MIQGSMSIPLSPVLQGLEHVFEQFPDHDRKQQCANCRYEEPGQADQRPPFGNQPPAMGLLELAIDFCHRRDDHRCIVLDLRNTCAGQVLEQWLRVFDHVLVHLARRPVGNIHQHLSDPGKERLAVTAAHEAAEEMLVWCVAQAHAQHLSGECLKVAADAPRPLGISRDVHQHALAAIEQPAFTQHIEYDDLLQRAAKSLQLPGDDLGFMQRVERAVTAQLDHQVQFRATEHPFGFGLAGVDQHAGAVQLLQR
ncbi:hypothetical protein D3C78_1123880 [compost metagenome]